ncbi:NTP transferase domain-containing protein [Gemmatimonadota bacterium]
MIAATVLAAGASKRMGFPKALLDYRGRTFLQSILDVTEVLGLQRLVALGHDADKVLAQHDLHGVTRVTNQEMAAGPIGSIRASIRAIENHPFDALLVWPVDFPHVAVDTAQALIDRFSEHDMPAIVIPEYEGRGGHPVIFGRSVFDELLSVSESVGAKAVVLADSRRVARISVSDSAVVDRLNTPDAYRDLVRRTDQQLQ